MSDLRQAAQQALEALEGGADSWQLVGPAIDALKAALAEQAEPDSPERRCGGPGCDMRCCQPVEEPVAWLFTNLQSGDYDFCYQEDEHDHDREMWHKQPLYTAPRVPLAEWQINDLMANIDPEDRDSWSFRQGVYAAEKHHGVRK